MTDLASHYDAVIVGAGPAGSTAACALLTQDPNVRVLLVDKSDFPRDKCCGDGLGPGVIDVIERLKLKGVTDGEEPITGCTILGPGGVSLDAELPPINGRKIVGYVIARTDLDERLRQNALERGATFAVGRFGATHLTSSGRVVELETASGRRQINASLLIGADGASSRVRKALSVARGSDRTTGIAIRAYVDVQHDPTDGAHRLLFEFSEHLLPAYAWFFPGAGNTANIGLGVPVADHKRRNLDLNELLDQFVGMLAARGYELGPVRARRTYLLPNAARLPKLAHDRAVLIGDAGSMINPLSGEGIFYGMAAGEMVGVEVATALGLGLDPTSDLRRFERAFRERFVWHYRSNFFAQQLLRSSWWSRQVIQAAARDEQVLASAVQLLFGEGAINARGTGRILRASLLRR